MSLQVNYLQQKLGTLLLHNGLIIPIQMIVNDDPKNDDDENNFLKKKKKKKKNFEKKSQKKKKRYLIITPKPESVLLVTNEIDIKKPINIKFYFIFSMDEILSINKYVKNNFRGQIIHHHFVKMNQKKKKKIFLKNFFLKKKKKKKKILIKIL